MLILPYDPQNAVNFNKIKAKLKEAITTVTINIEHVGSTAVQNLAAKPIVDIDIVYHHTEDFITIKKQLEAIDYYHNGNQDVEGREVFKRIAHSSDEILDEIVHHLYVCQHDCFELQRHLLFRDYLRTHESARIFYEKLKYQIAAEVNHDKKAYAELKQLKAKSFIDYLISLSEVKQIKFNQE